MSIILCIDDMPSRYYKLAELAAKQNIMCVVSCRLEEVNFYIRSSYKRIGACLDFDMPFGDGAYFARHIFMERNIPVVVSSMNPSGSKQISHILREYETSHIISPIDLTDKWAERALAFFQSR